MQCFLIHCKDCKVIKEVLVNDFSELPALCLAEEVRIYGENDGYAVYATHNGSIVADSEGLTSHWEPDREYQAQYAYACGYHD